MIDGNISATHFFLKHCDGKLTEEDLSEEGNLFAQRYYGVDGLYLDDYAKHFADEMYVKSEEEHDDSLFTNMIKARFDSNILTKTELKKSKRWWKFW